MIHPSPEFRTKWRRFRGERRAYFSLIVLATLFLMALPAEMLFNDRPLILRVDGKTYFPFLFDYSYRDLGGASDIPIQSYRSETFRAFLDGTETIVHPEVLFGDDKETVDIDRLVAELDAGSLPVPGEVAVERIRGPKHRVWMLSAPFRHSYDSYFVSKKLPQQNLANPFPHIDDNTGEPVPGAIEEGYYLGTDREGKCVLARLVYGFRISIVFGLALAVSGTVIGCILGAVQGYFGGPVDLLGQRLTEIWGSIPQLYLLIILGAILGRIDGLSTWWQYLMIFGILNLFAWMGMAAHMRAMFLRARNLDYVKAARALGVSDFQIMMRHILPNSLTPIVTFVPFAVTGGVLALVSLDFLGFGVIYPAPSLGELIKQGQENLFAWWILLPTFVTLVVLLMLLTFIGEGVRNAFDPRRKA